MWLHIPVVSLAKSGNAVASDKLLSAVLHLYPIHIHIFFLPLTFFLSLFPSCSLSLLILFLLFKGIFSTISCLLLYV